MDGGMWGAIAQSGTDMMQTGASFANMMQQHKWANEAASDQQNFAQFMANTTYRRAVRDMELAGLNPVLAVDRGGAPVPSVGQAGVPNVGIQTPKFSAKNVQEARQMDESLALLRAARQKTEHEAQTARYEAIASEAMPTRAWWQAESEAERWRQLRASVGLVDAQTAQTEAVTGRTRLDTELMSTNLPSAKALEELYTDYPWLRKFSQAVKDIVGNKPKEF